MKPLLMKLSMIGYLFAASSAVLLANPVLADVPRTTPAGITLVEVMRELPISQPEVLWVRLGDSNGRTLFTQTKTMSSDSPCDDACNREFEPVIAPRRERGFADWSTVRRDDGLMQWAYQSQPLYTWKAEEVPGEVATNVGLTETANSKFAEDAVEAGSLLPPDGWKVVRFNPAASIDLPIGFDARLVNAVQSVVLTDAKGHTIYLGDSDDLGDHVRWAPVVAPQLAVGTKLGDFSVITRKDGESQWTFNGQKLFAYRADKLPGDALGAGVDERFEVAAISKNFHPKGIDVRVLDGYGATLTSGGKTLYGGYPFEKRWGGRNLRDSFTYLYKKGKQLGDAACAAEDEACVDSWTPLIVSETNPSPSGFWEVIQREDGRKQWAYKGFALYTYNGDRAPGDHFGQATYDFAEVEGELSFQRVSFLQGIANSSGGTGVYWNIAKP